MGAVFGRCSYTLNDGKGVREPELAKARCCRLGFHPTIYFLHTSSIPKTGAFAFKRSFVLAALNIFMLCATFCESQRYT